MSDVSKELNGAAFRITTTRPRRGLDAEKAARQAATAYGQERSHTTFPSMGESVIDEIDNRSATEAARNEILIQRSVPHCIECGFPVALHHPQGEVVVTPLHRPVYRTPGVTPGVERYDENDENSPNRIACRPEVGQFMLAVDETDPEYHAAALRWNRAVARHRPDPTHPANWPEID